MDIQKIDILNTFLNENRGKNSISENIEGYYFNSPFPHLLFKNVFKDAIYNRICEYSKQCLEKIESSDFHGAKYGKITTLQKIHMEYMGNNLFISKDWSDLLSNIFDLKLSKYMASTLHLHEGTRDSESVRGWVHTDRDLCCFNDTEKDKEDPFLTNGQFYQVWSPKQVTDFKLTLQVRAAAYLYYFNNKPDLTDDDGGGTAIYLDAKGNNLHKIVEPINNSLFVFKITNNSFHGVLPAKFFRYANVGWVHSDAAEYLKLNFEEWEKDKVNFLEMDNNMNNNVYYIEKSENYTKHFDKPLRFF